MAAMKRAVPVLLLLSLALPATAFAAPKREHDRGGPIRGGLLAPPKHHALPAGDLEVSPAMAPAGLTGEVTFTVRLDRDAGGAALLAELPQIFVKRAASGLRYAGTPRLRATANGRATSAVSGRELTVDLGSAPAGSQVSFSIDVSGLPAGTWPISLRWRDAGGGTQQLGTAAFALVPARREPGSEDQEQRSGAFGKLAPFRLEQDVSNDSTEESETFVAANPANPDRVVSAANDISDDGTGGVFLSEDAGQSFTALHFPTTFSLPGGGSEHEVPSGDPIAAADDLGNVWVGGLSVCDPGTATSRSHIFVNRIAAGASSFRPANAAIPFFTGDGGGNCGSSTEAIQDKPQMTIDDWSASPTYGRLYVTWDDLDLVGGDKGSVHEVISFCDTRVAGVSQAARCDIGSNWSAPIRISDAGGSYITSDPAVGPDGTVYVAWWDYSANNRITIDHCASNCGSAANWGTDATIAVLSEGSVTQTSPQVPFACPIMAQPGGRAAPVPSVATAADGRLYVAWSDLRSGSGTTRCDIDALGFGSPPLVTHETFDSFVATAPDFATLTAGATTPSATRGTRIFTDTDTTPTAANSDDWFPWVAVDHSTGNAYVDVYSTVGDATRRTANFYLATVTPPASGTQPTISTPGKLTEVPSDYSQSTDPVPGGCCQFQNDYGDYEGLAAAGGVVYPVWAFRTGFGDDGDIHMDVSVRRPRATTGDASDVSPTTATVNGTVNPGGAKATYHFDYGPTGSYGSRAPTTDGVAGSDAADHAVSAALSGLTPGTAYHYRLVATSCGGCGGGTVAGPDRVFTTAGEATPPTTTGTDTTPVPPPVDRTAPRLKVTFAKRADRRGRYTIKLAAAGEAAAGRVTLRLATGSRRKLASRLIATSGSKSFKLVLKLKRKDLALLRRKRKLRVTLTVSLTDVAGNTARGHKTFTLRLKR
jgi:hypothetical protein